MDHERLPRQILYSQILKGKWNQERPRLRFQDTIKRNMKRMDVNNSIWQEKAKVGTAGKVLLDLDEENHWRTGRLLMMMMTSKSIQLAAV